MITLAFAVTFLVGGAACGGAEERSTDAQTAPATPSVRPLAIGASEYAFDAPASIEGGPIEVTFTNIGKEPHFVGFAKAAPGKSFADVRAALTAAPPTAAPPGGPPPFEPFAGVPAVDAGLQGNMVLNLAAGTYALFCSIPAPDGAPHVAKGMVRELTVSAGPLGALPGATQTVKATDFSFAATTADLVAGTQVVKLRNEGRQLHEINLVELAGGKDTDDAVAWVARPNGPPPYRSLGGVAVRPGEEATTELDLRAGKTYAFICVIPDLLGDRAPHAVKGMITSGFEV